MNKNLVLLRTLLLSTSGRNSLKYCKDKKKRGKIIGSYIGKAILFLMLAAYCTATCIGYGMFGLADSIPVMCATLISVLSFFLTFFKTNGYLFNFREYDMLMSLPYESRQIAACKFAYMYLNSLPWYLCVSVSMLIGYGISVKAAVIVYPIWMLLSLLLPLIPMLAAAFLGFLIAKVSARFQNKSIAMTVFSTLLVLACFGLRFFLEDMFRENKTEAVLNKLSETTGAAGNIYLPIKWFTGAVTACRISDILLLAGISLCLFEIVFILIGKSYRKINSALQSHASAGKFVLGKQKRRSLVQTIAFKEFKRMTGSSVYMTNSIIGQLLCIITGIAVLFVDIDSLLKKVLQDAPLTKEMLYPAIPLIVYFFVGMVATTACSPSLEGKNYWIVQSLPIRKKTLYQGKMLFNLYLSVPFALFAAAAICFSAKAPLLNTVLNLLLVVCLCAFSTAWGCVCGVRYMRLDWENEVEVVKQGTAVAVYLFPNMLLTMGLTVLAVYLGTIINQNLVTAAMIGVFTLLAALAYCRVLKLAKE